MMDCDGSEYDPGESGSSDDSSGCSGSGSEFGDEQDETSQSESYSRCETPPNVWCGEDDYPDCDEASPPASVCACSRSGSEGESDAEETPPSATPEARRKNGRQVADTPAPRNSPPPHSTTEAACRAKNSKADPGKRLFELVAERYSSSPKELYLRYLRNGCDTKIPFKGIAESATHSDKYFEACYRLSDASLPAKYFNGLEFGDLAKFEKSVLPNGTALLAFLEKSYERKMEPKYYKLYDGRYNEILCKEGSATRKKCVIVCVNRETKAVRMVPYSHEQHQVLFRHSSEELIFGPIRHQQVHKSPAQAVAHGDFAWCSDEPGSVIDLVEQSEELAAVVPQNVLVVAHRNTVGKKTLKDMAAPKSNDFLYLALLKKRGCGSDPWGEGMKVKMLIPAFSNSGHKGFRVRTLTQEWAEAVWMGYKYTAKRGTHDSHLTDALLKLVGDSTKNKREKARAKREATRDRRKEKRAEIRRKMDMAESALLDDDLNEYWSQDEDEEVECPGGKRAAAALGDVDDFQFAEREVEIDVGDGMAFYPCSCDDCIDSADNYGKSVRSEGPQQRQDAQPDTFEYLKIFGIDTAENRAIVRRVLALSVAAFDIEATTEFIRGEHDGLPYEAVSNVRYPTGKVAVQRACKLGHGDSFGDGETFAYREFDEADTGSMVSEWYSYMRKRRKKLAEQKEELLQPLLSHMRAVVRVMQKYYAARAGDEPDMEFGQIDAAGAIKNSLPGKFLVHLHKKIQEMKVFSFNGTSYDHVLVSTITFYEPRLAPITLVSVAGDQRPRVRLQGAPRQLQTV